MLKTMHSLNVLWLEHRRGLEMLPPLVSCIVNDAASSNPHPGRHAAAKMDKRTITQIPNSIV